MPVFCHMRDLMSHLYSGKQVSKPHLLKHRQFASPVFKESVSQPLHRMYWVWWISKNTSGNFFQKRFLKSQNYRMVCIRYNLKDHLIPTPINIYIFIYTHIYNYIKPELPWKSESVRGFLTKALLFLDIYPLKYILDLVFTLCRHFGYT